MEAPDRHPTLWAALVFLATLVFFLPPSGVRFLNWDDEARVVSDSSIHGLDPDHLYAMVTSFSVASYTPLERLSCALDWAFWGADAWGFRFVNALFHAANAALWFLLSWRLILLGGGVGRPALAAAVASALAFALHPLRVESVAWISERRDVLALFWSLLAVLLHLRGRERGAGPGCRGGWEALVSWLCFLCALLSKASAAFLPVVLWLLDAFPLRRFGPGNWCGVGRCLLEKVPWFVGAGLVGGVALLGQHHQAALVSLGVYPFGPRVLHASLTLATWCARWVVPVGLGPYYPPFAAMADAVRVVAWLSLAWVLGVSLVAARGFRHRPAIAVAWFAFLAMALPFSGLAQAGGAGVADRYTYMAMLPAALLFGCLLLVPSGRPGRVAVLVALAVVLALWAWETRRLLPIWNHSRALWTRGVVTAPGCDIPLGNLACAVFDDGDIALSRVLARDAVRVGPFLATSRASLALALIRQGRNGEAVKELDALLRLNPGDHAAHTHLVSLLPLNREGPRVLRHAFAALQCGGGTEAELNLAIVLVGTGHESLGVKYLWRAAEDGSAQACLALAALHERRGDCRGAVGVLRRGFERTGDRRLLREAFRILGIRPMALPGEGSSDRDRRVRP